MSNASMKRVLGIALALSVFVVSEAGAQTYKAVAGTFVGTAAQCAPSPAGNRIVTARWENGSGLPDNGVAHPDGTAHQGLYLSKNGPTPNCSAPGADITGWTSGNTLEALGFDYRLGTHCGAGAARFNVFDTSNNLYVFGCNHGDLSPAPQDPAQWARRTFTGPVGTPSTYPGSAGFIWAVTLVDSIQIIFDEGTDTASPDGNAPAGVGLTTLDNIRIDNTFITRKSGNPILP